MGKAAGGERGGQHKNKRESWAGAGCGVAPRGGRPAGKVNSASSRGRRFLLTAAFFLCFIEFLQRVQQFLWGEDVRGACGGRGKGEGGASVMASRPPRRTPAAGPAVPGPPRRGRWKCLRENVRLWEGGGGVRVTGKEQKRRNAGDVWSWVGWGGREVPVQRGHGRWGGSGTHRGCRRHWPKSHRGAAGQGGTFCRSLVPSPACTEHPWVRGGWEGNGWEGRRKKRGLASAAPRLAVPRHGARCPPCRRAALAASPALPGPTRGGGGSGGMPAMVPTSKPTDGKPQRRVQGSAALGGGSCPSQGTKSCKSKPELPHRLGIPAPSHLRAGGGSWQHPAFAAGDEGGCSRDKRGGLHPAASTARSPPGSRPPAPLQPPATGSIPGGSVPAQPREASARQAGPQPPAPGPSEGELMA